MQEIRGGLTITAEMEMLTGGSVLLLVELILTGALPISNVYIIAENGVHVRPIILNIGHVRKLIPQE
jgi:hypothetical protein